MKKLLHFLVCLTALLGLSPCLMAAPPTVNITPAPAKMTIGDGSYVIPAGFSVALAQGLPADMATEVDKFVETYAAATGNQGKVSTGSSGAFTVALDSKVAPEGYTLKVSPRGVAITASTPAGLFYAFQSVKKMLPANVMAGLPSAASAVYELPIVDIADEPRFGYRGYMLDVSRHFFDSKEIKRLLDIMSFYKLNTFHFHLTDDQGWRFPVEKYPLLTTVGATAPNAQFVDMATATEVWLNRPYGPYAYTKDELRDLVAYAAERHIEIIPEIEMPGHFSAAITAYPHLSCNPDGSHKVWTSGGISGDVLNIGNPAAYEFAKDVLSELMEVFPSKRIHIGGDECPDGNWKTNAYCKNLLKQLGLPEDNFRALQSYFTEQMAAFAAEHGRELIVWNESITAGGSDIDAIKRANPIVMCWVGAWEAATQAQNAGLRHIYTPQVPFYINRRLPGSNIPANGGGDSSTPDIYNHDTPDGNNLCLGVQGTFWTERVATPEYLEYLLLPRLMAIAENGWTPKARRDYADFSSRMTLDAALLSLLNYNFYTGPTGIQLPNEDEPSDPSTGGDDLEGKWFQLIAQGSGDRNGRAIELLADGSSLIGTNNAQAGRLWLNTPADVDAQLWQFEKGANGLYALVNKTNPNGSVNPTPTGTDNKGRWDYDPAAKHYNFSLPEQYRSNAADGSLQVAITSDKISGAYMNASQAGQGFAVNCWNDPADLNGGIWKLAQKGGSASPSTPAGNEPAAGVFYQLIAQGSGDRNGKAIELLADGSSLIGTNNAQAGRLWLNTPADVDAQLWQFEKGANGLYALVNKTNPNGSVNPTPTGTDNKGRWDYDPAAKHYNFSLPEQYRSNAADGSLQVAITSDKISGAYMNASQAGQGFAVNCWNDPADLNGGIWKLAQKGGSTTPSQPADPGVTATPFAKFVEGKTYTFTNAVIEGAMIADLGGDRLAFSSDPSAATIWRATDVTDNADGTQSIALINTATGRAISFLAPFESGYGQGVTLGAEKVSVTVDGVEPDKTISLSIGPASFWPLTATSSKYPSTITAGNSDNAALPGARALGAEWIASEVTPVTLNCQAAGQTIATLTIGIPVGETISAANAPAIPGYSFVSAGTVASGKATVTYRRTSYTVTYLGELEDGTPLASITVEAPADEPYTVAYPARPAMTLVKGSQTEGSKLSLSADLAISATYSTEAHLGVMELGQAVTEIKPGHSYLIHDDHADRNAYRVASGSIVGGKRALPLGPEAIWQFKPVEGGYALFNESAGKYIGQLVRGASCPLSDAPVANSFSFASDHWNIKQGSLAWDGGPDFTLHGWSGDGHPYSIYEFVAAPYFLVATEAFDEQGNSLGSTKAYGAAGENFIFVAPAYEGFFLKSIEGHHGLDCLLKDHAVKLVYSTDPTTGIEAVTPDGAARPAGIYDLHGRRLRAISAPGLYIIDGVKTLVK
ncbi:MAG: beta-N-acetylhexosaminidase [Pseudoflavonifractor sp.]|nr:beta-N-acetylhexosaminidase [Alloprevotella sp.]MCM1117617.1 beta-N-acetylhexosaminidase [Pseudoflavonifractor sp.]